MRYGSLCSGIEAATVAWHPLGWYPVFFSEIDPAASRVLHHHYGCGRPQFMPRSDVPEINAAERRRRGTAIKAVQRLIPAHAGGLPNLGDMTQFREWPDHAIDLLVGGTPCQSFSVAGLREGLADPRGNLALVYLAIADRYRPKWLVWENVPGVLSSEGGRDFGAILGAMGQLGYGWAYRVLDAQYVRVDGFGRAVPQRRRRVFVVGCLGDWRRAAAVLFERESLCGNTPPRRDAGKGFARGVEFGPSGGGYTDVNPTLDCRAKDGPIRNQLAGAVMVEPVSKCLNAGAMGRIDSESESESFVAHSLRASGFDASEDGTGRGTPLVPVAIQERAICENPSAGPGGSSRSYVSQQWAVRRLTPTECERLQGFPDSYTSLADSPKPQADGPRYKQLGNSMAVNAMRWIGTRIQMVEDAMAESEAA